MELDKKIKVKKIFDVFSDFEEVKKYYGKRVYCADFIENFSNLKLYTDRKILKTFFPQECKPFLCSGKQHRYVLPCEFVEQEKQYQAFTIDEFLDRFHFGEGIVVRSKAVPNIVYHVLFVGYSENIENGKNEENIILGQYRFSLQELFQSYERFYLGRWYPFGVEE